jgi:hypothetical protein
MVQRAAEVDRGTDWVSNWGRGAAGAIYLIANLAAIGTLANSPRFDPLVAALIAIAATYFLILIHELGHAAAVISLKGRVLMFAVGPIAAQFGPFKLGFAPSLDRDRREVGGFVLATFDGRETTRMELIVAAAGPVANLLFAAVLGLLLTVLAPATVPPARFPAIAVQENAPVNAPVRVALPSDAEVVRVLRDERAERQYRHLWSPLIIALIILSLAAGVANLTPYRGSDGDEIRRAIRDMMEARRYSARRDAR